MLGNFRQTFVFDVPPQNSTFLLLQQQKILLKVSKIYIWYTRIYLKTRAIMALVENKYFRIVFEHSTESNIKTFSMTGND